MGRRPRRRRRPVSTATRAKISAALRGKKHPHRGVRPSAAARAHESAAHKGKRHPHRGHRLSAATRAKISAALRRRRRRCHCGSSSKHSLTRRRVAHAQGVFKDSLIKTPKATKTRGKKRNKVHAKVRATGLWGEALSKASAQKHFAAKGKKTTGKCHCPKKHAKKHARMRRVHSRAAHHRTRQQHNKGKTTIGFSG